MDQIFQKVVDGRRLSIAEGRFLFAASNLEYVKQLINIARERKSGNRVSYTSCVHIYPTNACQLRCPLCSFFAKEKKDAWFLTPEQIEEKVRASRNFDEVHIVGGIDPHCSLPYYKEVFSRIKSISEKIHIKALTAPEIHFLATTADLSIEDTILELKKSGLDFVPGGGAEILVDRIRKIIAPKKISSCEFLKVHEIAHRCGIPSNITMLFGHIEDYEDILCHLDRVRCLQDKTGMIQAFVPIPFQPKNTLLSELPLKEKCLKKIYAVSSLMLDNISHMKVLWNYTGMRSAQELLEWGGNDFGAIVQGEKISSQSDKELITEEVLRKAILEMGRIPLKVRREVCCALESSIT